MRRFKKIAYFATQGFCEWCGEPFVKNTANQKYCDHECAYKKHRAVYVKKIRLHTLKGQTRTCKKCGKEFELKSHGQIYCSHACSKNANRIALDLGLDSGTTGAMSELMVAVDLIKKGYEVYRALSPHSSSDLLCKKQDIVTTVEVRTGCYSRRSKKLCFPKQRIRSDIVAVAVGVDGKIYYFRSSDIETTILL